MSALAPLFGSEQIAHNDSPRARRRDKATSHIAADASQKHILETKMRVLRIVRDHGSLVGSEINDQYQLYASRLNWQHPAFDTPRKRAGELAEDGYLDGSDTRIAEGNHLPESVYRLTDKGLAALGVAA